MKKSGSSDAAMESRRAQLMSVVAKINEDNKKTVITTADQALNPYVIRRPSGVMSLDIILRGGFPPGVSYLSGPDNVGKCLGLGTRVLTHSGETKKIEDIRAGDLVMGPDSAPRTVLSTTRGRGPMFRIVPKRGAPWTCNDRHVLTLVESCSGKVLDIPLSEYLARSAYFKKEHMLFQPGEGVQFPAPGAPVTVSPYFLGVWLGDGEKNLLRVSVTKPDAEIYEACVAEARQWGLEVRTDGEDGMRYRLVAGRGQPNPLLDEIRKLVGETIRIPSHYLLGSRGTREELLAGILDTDGHLGAGKTHYEICQRNVGLSEDIAFLARSLGFRVTVGTKTVDGTDYVRMLLLGRARLPLRIGRKVAEEKKRTKDQSRVGFRVEALGEGDYAGFMLDGDGRFLLADFTVTHNSHLMYRAMVMHQRIYGPRARIALACVETPLDHFFLRSLGLWIAVPDLVIEQANEARVQQRLPAFTKEEIKLLKTQVGDFLPISGSMEQVLDTFLHLLSDKGLRQAENQFGIIGCDSFTSLAPSDIMGKDMDEASKRAAHAGLTTEFYNKLAPKLTSLDGDPIYTSLLFTQQVRANPAKATAPSHMAKYLPDYATAGAWAAKLRSNLAFHGGATTSVTAATKTKNATTTERIKQ
jgi:hypothetical protein